jgi:hypothetical protein
MHAGASAHDYLLKTGCQTAAGCKCGRQWDYPVRLSMRTALTEYTDTELWSELYRRGTPPRGDQGVNVTVPGA